MSNKNKTIKTIVNKWCEFVSNLYFFFLLNFYSVQGDILKENSSQNKLWGKGNSDYRQYDLKIIMDDDCLNAVF